MFLFILLAQQVLLTHLLDHFLFLPEFPQRLPMVVLAMLLTPHFTHVTVMLVFQFVIKPTVPSAQSPVMPTDLELAVLVFAVVFQHCQAHLVAYLTIPRLVSYQSYYCYQLEY